MKRLIAGLDSGNSKTAFLCVDEDGGVVAATMAGPSNYQTLGREGCLKGMKAVVAPHAEKLKGGDRRVVGWGFGLAGLDRLRDLDILGPLVEELTVAYAGTDVRKVLFNDAFLSLRAGTADGVGVAVSAGTSGNCVGMNAARTRIQIGGIAAELGDGAGGFDIAIQGLKAAGRARDGRAPATRIADLYMQALGISDIADVIDFMIPGNPGPAAQNVAPTDLEQPIPPIVGLLAPLVFKAASEGDIVARNILEGFGRELGVGARVAAFRLGFGPQDRFSLVLGGSVLQKATEPTYRNAIIGEVASMFPNVEPVTLTDHPVVGAVLYGFDAAGIEVTPKVRNALSLACSVF